jgi:hypothetical protein
MLLAMGKTTEEEEEHVVIPVVPVEPTEFDWNN